MGRMYICICQVIRIWKVEKSIKNSNSVPIGLAENKIRRLSGAAARTGSLKDQ